jgi:hypothetical protein
VVGWAGFFNESEVALCLKRTPNYALDNADIVKEAIYRELREGLSPRVAARRRCARLANLSYFDHMTRQTPIRFVS